MNRRGTLVVRCERRRLQSLTESSELALDSWDLEVDPTEDPALVDVSPRTLRGAIALLRLAQNTPRPSHSEPRPTSSKAASC